jgi:hypothetical protein
MGFVFTNEVEFSPATTLGSAPENNRWTANRPNWCNDWSCAAGKMACLMADCLIRGHLTETWRNSQ